MVEAKRSSTSFLFFATLFLCQLRFEDSKIRETYREKYGHDPHRHTAIRCTKVFHDLDDRREVVHETLDVNCRALIPF